MFTELSTQTDPEYLHYHVTLDTGSYFLSLVTLQAPLSLLQYKIEPVL